jgi:cephalosporin hydroxylase
MFSDQTIKNKLFAEYKEKEDVMPKEDAMAILKYIEKIKSDLPILEIGTYEGNTTALIADYLKALGRKNLVITIDPFDLFWSDHDPSIAAKVRLNGKNVKIIKGFSTEINVINQIKETSLTFVDGGHDKSTVISDIKNYFPKTKEYFLLHDINYQGVKDALNEVNANIKTISNTGGNTGIGLLKGYND